MTNQDNYTYQSEVALLKKELNLTIEKVEALESYIRHLPTPMYVSYSLTNQ
jgi:hypothetical protein